MWTRYDNVDEVQRGGRGGGMRTEAKNDYDKE